MAESYMLPSNCQAAYHQPTIAKLPKKSYTKKPNTLMKKVERKDHLQKNYKTERGLSQNKTERNKRGDQKAESNDNPEIRGGGGGGGGGGGAATSNIPSLQHFQVVMLSLNYWLIKAGPHCWKGLVSHLSYTTYSEKTIVMIVILAIVFR